MTEINVLNSGVFTVPLVANLIGVSKGKVRRWVDGQKEKQAAIIDNELGRVDNKLAVSFTNLMELQFVAFFVKAGVKLHNIRAILQEAKSLLNHPHPFATKTVFMTDKRKIVTRIVRDNGVDHIYDLKTKNYEMEDVVMQSLERDMVYDPSGNASIWYPRRAICPSVVVNPCRSFGRPVLKESSIPTEIIAQTFAVEKNLETVSLMFDISEQQVSEAIKFELSLRVAA
jgi:uncharacterized protein (DUF433 family)